MSEIEGLSQLNATLKKLERDAGKFSKSAYIAGGKIVESDAKKSIQSKSGGESVVRYRSGGGGYNHTVSTPNDAPNTDTGRLVASINTEIANDGVFVGTTLEYGKFLEFGTKNMTERPWLIPALVKNEQTIIDLQISAVNKSIRAGEHNV